MLIILEGPDGAGKTTFATKLAEQLKALDPRGSVTLLHRGPPTSHPLDEYVVPLLQYDAETQHIICDRWHLGETIYPAILGRKTKMTPGILKYIELFLESRGAFILKIQPTWRELQAWNNGRKNLLDAQQLWDAYLAWSNVNIPWVEHPIVTDIITHAGLSAGIAFGRAMRKNTQTYVGPAFPNVLLLGEIRNCMGGIECDHAIKHPAHGTALMPYPGTSGQYLLDALASTGLVGNYGLANACDVDNVNDLWWALGCPRVIALGVQAHKRLTNSGIPHSSVPHPQFIRRFHHHSGNQYAQLIHAVSTHRERNQLSWRPTSSTARTDKSSTLVSSRTS